MISPQISGSADRRPAELVPGIAGASGHRDGPVTDRTAGRRPTTNDDVHGPTQCAARGCTSPHASGHHMREWPTLWRAGRKYHERICRHGYGHPDPDDVLDRQAVGGVRTDHRCDGCCVAPVRSAGLGSRH